MPEHDRLREHPPRHTRSRKGITIDWNETIKKADRDAQEGPPGRESRRPRSRNSASGKQQLVEIAKALSRDVKLLILDEPTAALNEDDCDNLLEHHRGTQGKQGVTCVLISHKLKEVITDRRHRHRAARRQDRLHPGRPQGRGLRGRPHQAHGGPRDRQHLPQARQAHLRRGRARGAGTGRPTIPGLGRTVLKDINFKLQKGEIVGFAGLMGSGRTELARSIFGNPDGYQLDGELLVEGRVIATCTSPRRRSGPASPTPPRTGRATASS